MGGVSRARQAVLPRSSARFSKRPPAPLFSKRPTITLPPKRPTASRPRYLFLRQGTFALPVEDLSVKRPSVFDESRIELAGAVVGTGFGKSVFPSQTKKGAKYVEWKSSSANACTVAQKNFPETKLLGPNTDSLLSPRLLAGEEVGEKSATIGASLISDLREKALLFKQTGVNPDLMAEIATVLSLGQRDKTEELASWKNESVKSLLEKGGSGAVDQFNKLIRAKNYFALQSEAKQVHDQMVALGYLPDAGTYLALLCDCASAADARETFLLMRKRLVAPTQKIFGALVHAHVKEGDLRSGFALLRKMEDDLGVREDISVSTTSNTATFSSPIIHTMLINGLVEQGRLELAWNHFREIRTWKGVKPDAVLFTVLIKACSVNSECEKALSVLDDLRTSGEFPTDVTYLELIKCMSLRADFAHKAFEFYDQLLAEGFSLNADVGIHLTRAAAELGDLVKIKKIVKQLINANIPLKEEVFVNILKCVGTTVKGGGPRMSANEKSSLVRFAWHIVSAVKERGVAVTVPLMNELVRLYALAQYPDHAVSMLAEFEQLGLAPDTRTYEILLEMYGRADIPNVGKFFALFDACTQGLSPCSFQLALDVALFSKSSKRTVHVLEQMASRKIFPLPAQAEQLAKVGRKIVQIHQVVARMVDAHREQTHEKMVKDNALVQLQVQEHEVRLALEGKTTKDPSLEQEARDIYFKRNKTTKSPKLPKTEFLQVKKKGGSMHARRIDKPSPNLLVQ